MSSEQRWVPKGQDEQELDKLRVASNRLDALVRQAEDDLYPIFVRYAHIEDYLAFLDHLYAAETLITMLRRCNIERPMPNIPLQYEGLHLLSIAVE